MSTVEGQVPSFLGKSEGCICAYCVAVAVAVNNVSSCSPRANDHLFLFLFPPPADNMCLYVCFISLKSSLTTLGDFFREHNRYGGDADVCLLAYYRLGLLLYSPGATG